MARTHLTPPIVPAPTAGNHAVNRDYVTTQTGLLVPKSLVDAKGDLLVGTADNTLARLPVGADGSVLTSDTTQASGVKWEQTIRVIWTVLCGANAAASDAYLALPAADPDLPTFATSPDYATPFAVTPALMTSLGISSFRFRLTVAHGDVRTFTPKVIGVNVVSPLDIASGTNIAVGSGVSIGNHVPVTLVTPWVTAADITAVSRSAAVFAFASSAAATGVGGFGHVSLEARA